MPGRIVAEGINNPRMRQILLVFSIPRTPKQAAIELSVKEVRCWEFLKMGLLKCLNPGCRKSRFYILTDKARESLGLNCSPCDIDKDWEVIGWIISSPMQRLAVLRCVTVRKRNSEEIRMIATQLNCRLSRTSIKTILKHLIEKHLVDAEIIERVRFYWITEYGQKIKDETAVLSPLAPAIFGT